MIPYKFINDCDKTQIASQCPISSITIFLVKHKNFRRLLSPFSSVTSSFYEIQNQK